MAATPVNVDALQKAELHCHSDGLLDPAMLTELAAAGQGLALSAEALAAVCPVSSAEDWGRYQALVDPCLSPFDRTLLVIDHHLRRLQRQNVIYTELFVNRLLAARPSAEATVELFQELRERVDRLPGLTVGLVVCVGRGGAERFERQRERIVPLARAGLICGVALAGDEKACRVADLGAGLRRLRDEGLGIEIHAGELLGPESVEDALDHGVPHRLGHAIAAFSEPRLVERLLRENIHVELCPTSNLRLGAVLRIEDHPLPVAHRLGVSFSINTDDPGPFGCSLTSELALVRDSFGFTADDFERVLQNTLAARFTEGDRARRR